MKQIIKRGQSHTYTGWRNQMKGTGNEDYRHMPGNIRADLLDTLVIEQGYLCGYTMRRIDTTTSHVEHIKPESVCRAEKKGSDLDYENLIACHPKKSTKNNAEFIYGAIYKNNWWDNNGTDFISPLKATCTQSFNFNLKGEIQGLDTKAKTTVKVLRLDHKSLTDDRKRAIEIFVYDKEGIEPISKTKAERILGEICDFNASGEYVEFCVAIKCALEWHLKKLDKISKLRKLAKPKSIKKK